jgi:hypothetical protein
MLASSWVAAQLAAPQEVLSSVSKSAVLYVCTSLATQSWRSSPVDTKAHTWPSLGASSIHFTSAQPFIKWREHWIYLKAPITNQTQQRIGYVFWLYIQEVPGFERRSGVWISWLRHFVVLPSLFLQIMRHLFVGDNWHFIPPPPEFFVRNSVTVAHATLCSWNGVII